jgi:HSP20 family protein
MAKAKKSKKNSAPIVRSDGFFETFQQLQDKIRDRAFDIFQSRDGEEGDAMSDWLAAESDVLTSIALDFEEKDDRYVLTGKVPEEFEADEIEIDVSEGMLSVGGTHKTEKSEKKGKSKKEVRSEVSFMRRMSLPEDADVDGIDTRYDKGKLKLTLPKRAA